MIDIGPRWECTLYRKPHLDVEAWVGEDVGCHLSSCIAAAVEGSMLVDGCLNGKGSRRRVTTDQGYVQGSSVPTIPVCGKADCVLCLRQETWADLGMEFLGTLGLGSACTGTAAQIDSNTSCM